MIVTIIHDRFIVINSSLRLVLSKLGLIAILGLSMIIIDTTIQLTENHPNPSGTHERSFLIEKTFLPTYKTASFFSSYMHLEDKKWATAN